MGLLYLLCLSKQTVTFVLYTIKRLVFITEMKSVYSAVRTGSLYKTNMFRPYPFPIQFFCQPHTPQLLFVLGGKEVGGLLVIILQF
jgi:hypothetical protein